MSLKRLGVVQPVANTDTFLGDVNTQYLSSVLITNLNTSKTADITVYVKPTGITDPTKYVYVAYNIPLERKNSFETNKFAMNPLDEIWIRSSVSSISFTAIGIPQGTVSVRYSSGPTANIPTAPIAGDQFYDTTQNLLFLYKPTGWKQVTTS